MFTARKKIDRFNMSFTSGFRACYASGIMKGRDGWFGQGIGR
jgi:hypothetical protein